ncbi:hypothetical protein ACFQBS_35985 [Planomonospora parontospora]|uniref:hypothetical protein n=1 Tax=Planomonospora parontospora TaxID=58119 RepID=UPI003614BB7A
MSGIEIFLGVLLGLIVNEMCDISPWLAGKLVRLSARWRYSDPELAEARGAELTRVINDRPGKLFKLGTAIAFLTSSAADRAWGMLSSGRLLEILCGLLLRSAPESLCVRVFARLTVSAPHTSLA